ncbi:MAG: glycoside hydrolase family 88 protein [Chloroflexota bacterium]|nr:glycoside hydrolase family 88 protein [Chloroflexota bacterium]
MNNEINLKTAVDSLAKQSNGIWIPEVCGITQLQTQVPALVHRDMHSNSDQIRVLLVGGFSGQIADVEIALNTLRLYLETTLHRPITLSAIPCTNPDQLTPEAGTGNELVNHVYPPVDGYFNHTTQPETRYIWRWACFQGPDLVLEIADGVTTTWETNNAALAFVSDLGAKVIGPDQDGSFIAALATETPSGLAPIPGLRLTVTQEALPIALKSLWSTLLDSNHREPAPVRRILSARRSRTPIEVAKILALTYGHTLSPVVYTQGVAISGRLRLAELEPDGGHTIQDIVSLVESCSATDDNVFSATPPTTELAGMIWGDELARATGDNRYANLVVRIADRYIPAAPGKAPIPSDPDFRTEDMFMNGAMLGRAFAITGDHRYADILTKFLLDANIQQENGLFWHCRSAPYHWGRGNGFAVMGFTEALTYLPEDNSARSKLLAIYRLHLHSLIQLQCSSGMFRQVLDVPGSYPELTATSMIGYAIARGLRMRWLGPSYKHILERCWQAVAERVQDDGVIVDGCVGTGVQSTLKEYLDRPAIHGFDDRTGGMAIWFATETARLQRDTP